ncbi:hypothetical protein Pr1d_18020 [Bythopirellula goksoeyrii]|uniref:Uncharacterized protein n=1 Tax=Bythopirellula goksoeyrii TaxID=1400387 RepID=A0A5B9QAN3_9BACT|nr:hypothetical protein Pr1d_18020 [Bythopirellula goksoeyrii]
MIWPHCPADRHRDEVGRLLPASVCINLGFRASDRNARGETHPCNLACSVRRTGCPQLVQHRVRYQRHARRRMDGANLVGMAVRLRAVSRRYTSRNCSSPTSGGLNDLRRKLQLARASGKDTARNWRDLEVTAGASPATSWLGNFAALFVRFWINFW